MCLTNYELKEIKGGFLNALLKIGRAIYNFGISLGSSIRRIINNKVCPI